MRRNIEVKVLKESGYEEALLGLSLNKKKDVENMPRVLERLAPLGGGHNKALAFIDVYLDIKACRHWWSQADTYIFFKPQNSESTMHTILDRELTQNDFANDIPESYLNHLNNLLKAKDLNTLKDCLPEGFIQRRIVKTNYLSLRNMISQRKNHKMPDWKFFCREIISSVSKPELLGV